MSAREVPDLLAALQRSIDAAKADHQVRSYPEPVYCDTCDDSGLVPWMVEGDPHMHQEPDADGTIPCPDCGTTQPQDPPC